MCGKSDENGNLAIEKLFIEEIIAIPAGVQLIFLCYVLIIVFGLKWFPDFLNPVLYVSIHIIAYMHFIHVYANLAEREAKSEDMRERELNIVTFKLIERYRFIGQHKKRE